MYYNVLNNNNYLITNFLFSNFSIEKFVNCDFRIFRFVKIIFVQHTSNTAILYIMSTRDYESDWGSKKYSIRLCYCIRYYKLYKSTLIV